MKPAKIISLHDYWIVRHCLTKKLRNEPGGIPLPSDNRLWVLLDRNISLAVWKRCNPTCPPSLPELQLV